MTHVCILVADDAQARFFMVVESADAPRGVRLQEIARLVNPEARMHGGGSQGVSGARREHHRLERERRFSALIVERAAKLVEKCRGGRMLVIAEPQLLGLLREPLRHALRSEIRLDELARDYSALSISELERVLVHQGLIS